MTTAAKLKDVPVLTLAMETTEHEMARNKMSLCAECGWGNVAWSPFFCVGCGKCQTCTREDARCANAAKSGYTNLTIRLSL